jgi:hypothetical protein
LVCSNSSASTASGGSQPAVNPCFIIGSKWLHALVRCPYLVPPCKAQPPACLSVSRPSAVVCP